MGAECSVKPKTALDGVHGVQVVPHSPFALEEIKQHGDLHKRSHASFPVGTRQHLIVQRVWQQRPGCLRPIRCSCHGDKTIAETMANVITSLPFIALGLQAPRKNLHCKLYANSLIGVGIVSSLYHASRGKIRRYMRWADYSMIATATVCLSRALRNENPKLLMAASAVLLPIQPLMVSAVHTGMMEVAFAKRAFQDPDLRMTHNVHKMSSLLGGALFIADDVFPETPFLHAGWHLAAAVGMIEKALQELNEKGGSSEESISDFIKKEHKSLPWAHATMLKHHLQKMTDQGEILMIDGRFLLPGDSESVNPKRKRKRKCTKRKKRRNSEIKQKSVQMEKEENKQVQHDDVEAVSKVNEEYRELNEHHNEPGTDKEDGQLSGQQNGVNGNKVFHRRVLRSTVHKQKGKQLFDATEGSLQSSVAIGSGIGSTPVEPPRFMMTEETEHLQDLELQQSKLSITTVEETAGDNLPQLLSPEAPPRFEFLALEDATANKAHTFSSIGLDLPKEDRVMHQSSDRPSKEETAAEDLLKTEKQQKKHHGWQQTNRPITRAQAKGTVTPNEQPISGRNRTQVKLAMESSSEPKQPSIENSTETDRAQRQLKRWSKNPGEPKSVSTSKVEPLALCDSADQQLVLVEEPLSILMEEPLALLIREEAMNLTDPQYEVRLKQPKDKRRKKALKDKDDGTDSDTTLLKDMRSTKKLAKKKNDRGGGRRRNAH